MTRQENSVTIPSDVTGNIHKIGKAIIDIHGIETDVQDGPAPRSVAVEYLTDAFIENNLNLFERKPDAHDGKRQVIYNGDNNE